MKACTTARRISIPIRTGRSSRALLLGLLLVSSILILVFLQVSAVTMPTIQISFTPSTPRPFDVVDFQSALDGAGHNITAVKIDFGDDSQQNLTDLNSASLVLHNFHAYKSVGIFQVVENASSDLCYSSGTCQYFYSVLSVETFRFPTTTILEVNSATVNISLAQPFRFTAWCGDNQNRAIPFANFSFYVLPLTTGPGDQYTWLLIGHSEANANGTDSFLWFPTNPDEFGVNVTCERSGFYDSSSTAFGFKAGSPMLQAIEAPEFPVSSIPMILAIPLCLILRRKFHR